MKRGDKVKCVDNRGGGYLTKGKVYEVMSGEGDRGLYMLGCLPNIIEGGAFEVLDDNGDVTFCCGLSMSFHATWELVE